MNGTLDEWQQLKAKDLAAFRKMIDPGGIPDYPPLAPDSNCGK